MNRRQFLTTTSTMTAAAWFPSCSGGSSKRMLTVFTWADYLSDEARKTFEEAYDCELRIDTFDSNEVMMAKIEAGAGGYDLLVPSSYAVRELDVKGYLEPLDHSKIPHAAHVDKAYLSHAIDKEMKVSVPYMMSPTCVAFLQSKLPDAEPSWGLFERREIVGRSTLLDDMREVLGAALKKLGYSLNSVVPAELESATKLAILWKSHIAKFENEQYKAGIASGEFHLVHGYAGDLMAARQENEEIEIVIPREGTSFSCDDLCILKSSSNKELAHAFINHLCDPKVAAENMQWIGYRAPNTPAYDLLKDDFKCSSLLFPEDELFAKCESIGYLGEHLALWSAAWERVKNA